MLRNERSLLIHLQVQKCSFFFFLQMRRVVLELRETIISVIQWWSIETDCKYFKSESCVFAFWHVPFSSLEERAAAWYDHVVAFVLPRLLWWIQWLSLHGFIFHLLRVQLVVLEAAGRTQVLRPSGLASGGSFSHVIHRYSFSQRSFYVATLELVAALWDCNSPPCVAWAVDALSSPW